MKTKTRQSIRMKATISEFDNVEATLWEGEAISVDWDGKTSDFVLRGKAGEDEFEAFMASVLNQDKVVVGIEDPTSTQLVWRGQVGELASAGTLGISSLAVGIEVGAGLFGVFVALAMFRRTGTGTRREMEIPHG